MKTFTHDQLTFDVLDQGKSKETVVLLHGFPANAVSWNPVTSILVKNHYRVLVPQQRGYSPNAQPKRRRDYKLSRLVTDVVALIDASGEASVHVVGHDWGGLIAWALASKYPERVSSLTIIAAPHPKALIRSLLNSRQAFLSWYMLFFQLPYIPEWILTRKKGQTLTKTLIAAGLNQRSATLYTKDMLSNKAQTLQYAINWYRALPFSLTDIRTIGTISRRTLYIHGDTDQYISAKAALLTHTYVTEAYEFKRLSNQSHWIPETSPDLVAEVILAFLNQSK